MNALEKLDGNGFYLWQQIGSVREGAIGTTRHRIWRGTQAGSEGVPVCGIL